MEKKKKINKENPLIIIAGIGSKFEFPYSQSFCFEFWHILFEVPRYEERSLGFVESAPAEFL